MNVQDETTFVHLDNNDDQQQPPSYATDPEELRVLLSTLSSFYTYRKSTHLNVTHHRRTAFYALPTRHREILNNPPISYLATLDTVDECIEHNAEVAEAILKAGADGFGIDLVGSVGWQGLAGPEDVDKARSTIKQFYRDWSVEGKEERERCYKPVMEVVEEKFGGVIPRSKVSILVPGAGLGRLAFELVRLGYTTQGNEFSYHQLVASNFILNCTDQAEQFTIHPFITSFSHHRSRENQTRAVKIPDIHPGTELLVPKRLALPASQSVSPSIKAVNIIHDDDDNNNNGDDTSTQGNQDGSYTFLPADAFSMIAGEFTEAYNTTAAKDTFDCVATVFFIDTAPNIIVYLETIANVLKAGGVWINLGPLLWHWEGRGDKTKKKHDHSLKPTHERDHDHEGVDSDEGSGHTHNHDHDHGNTSKEEEEPQGSVELTLDEVVALVEQFGFKIEQRRTIKTGYIEDDLGMLKWDYDAEFWVATKL